MNTSIPISEAELKEIQTKVFKDSLEEILCFNSLPKIECSGKGITSALAIAGKKIPHQQMLQLLYFADSWNMELTTEWKEYELQINFTLKNN